MLLAAPFDAETLDVTGPAVAVLENVSLDQLGSPMVALSSAGSLAYVASGNATKRLVWVSRQGVERPITDISRPYQNPRLAPDAHRIVVEVGVVTCGFRIRRARRSHALRLEKQLGTRFRCGRRMSVALYFEH